MSQAFSPSTSSQKRQRVEESDDEDVGPQDETLDEKEKRRQARVLRNRASAQNSRNRRKNHMIELEALVVKLQEENLALRSSSSPSSTPSTSTSTATDTSMDSLKAENQALRQRVALLESLVHQVLASSNPLAPSNQVNYGLPPAAFSPPAGNVECAPPAPIEETPELEMDYSFLVSATEPALISVDDSTSAPPATQTVSDDVWNALLHPALAPAAPTLAQPPVPSLDFTRHPAAGDLGKQGSESAALGSAIPQAEQSLLHGREIEAEAEDWSEDTSEAGEVLKAFDFDFGKLGGIEPSGTDGLDMGLGLWSMDGGRVIEA